MDVVDDKLVIFGGTQALVHEKNDILIYDCSKKLWKKIALENEIEILPVCKDNLMILPISF
jgi:hypothetical protein